MYNILSMWDLHVLIFPFYCYKITTESQEGLQGSTEISYSSLSPKNTGKALYNDTYVHTYVHTHVNYVLCMALIIDTIVQAMKYFSMYMHM